MSVETLEQKIAKQEERLRQLKAQKQAIAAREKRKVRLKKIGRKIKIFLMDLFGIRPKFRIRDFMLNRFD